jgi:hypothetical protein
LLALAAVIVAFVATWLTIPAGQYETHSLTTGTWTNRLPFPAALFRTGIRERDERCITGGRLDPLDPFRATKSCPRAGTIVLLQTDLHALKQRVLVFYGGLAAVVILVGMPLAR